MHQLLLAYQEQETELRQRAYCFYEGADKFLLLLFAIKVATYIFHALKDIYNDN